MTAADMASISEQPGVYQELVEASFIFSTIMEVLCGMQYKIVATDNCSCAENTPSHSVRVLCSWF